jgi:hypothetical protein
MDGSLVALFSVSRYKSFPIHAESIATIAPAPPQNKIALLRFFLDAREALC